MNNADEDDHDDLLTPQERYGWRPGEREQEQRELAERQARIDRDEALAWCRERAEQPGSRPAEVVTRSYSPPIPDTGDAIASARAAIDALRRSKPGNAAEARRRAGELIRAQQVLGHAASRVTDADAQKRVAVPVPAASRGWKTYVKRKLDQQERLLLKVIAQIVVDEELARAKADAEFLVKLDALTARLDEIEAREEWRSKTTRAA